ncbi:dipeptidase [Paenibacillus sp. N3.4]|uniref:dipeptidase n=1 Tax=Paenibacillus sp. N3.4 TaxID=2603222 RepID=UPI0011CA16FD|nr:dipeptidase [Paenibacillus sp. N3.4]TXK85948.1 membrane dipeptidase [Paenibacillus sp. N3.4]
MNDVQQIHQDAIVIDAVCPLLDDPAHLELYRQGGCTVVAPTVGLIDGAAATLRTIGKWINLINGRDDLVLIKRAADIGAAKASGKLGILFHFQGTGPIEDSLDLVDAYKELGVGIIQLAYNVKNRVGDGCEERTDAGLSRFGLKLIERMNRARVIVDCSHTGYRTTMEAIEASSAPVVFSHANPRAVHPSPRNIQDDQIKAIAATGGLVGAVGFPNFVSSSHRPSLDDFIAHIDYMVELVGIDHVGLGIDYFTGMDPITPLAVVEAMYKSFVDFGAWTPKSYSPPPYYYPTGMETPTGYPKLTARLLERGYKEEDVRKILGDNWVRVYRAVWGA